MIDARAPRCRAVCLLPLLAAISLVGCSPVAPLTPTADPTTRESSAIASEPAVTVGPTRLEHRTDQVVVTGEPIAIEDLSGRIVFDDFEDVFAMDVDGSNLVRVADEPGAEFDGAWSPNGRWVVYRDSTRGINENDEIFIARADGSERRNLTNHPANDWGPDWSPDGSTVVFNSDRDGGAIRGYLVGPDGSNLRRIEVDAWVEYPAFSPDGKQIAFMGALGSNYEVFVANLASGAVTRLTDSPGHDAWPVWSPDGSTIAFKSVRDDCRIAPRDRDCWRGGPEDEHEDIWLMQADGSNARRVTPEFGQFVAWSPDGDHLLISGHGLFVVRPDGTGRLELRASGIPTALGGMPDWRW